MDSEEKQLLKQVRILIRSARHIATQGVNTLQVMMNFEIGRLIVEHEQKGRKRAAYGKQILQDLSSELSSEFGRGFSKSNLEYMRRFFIEYKGRLSEIPQTASGQLLEKNDFVRFFPNIFQGFIYSLIK